MINNFKDKYAAYVTYMNNMSNSVAEFNTYEDFVEANLDTDLGASDFIRYKHNIVLTELGYWNTLIVQEKVRRKKIKEAIKSFK